MNPSVYIETTIPSYLTAWPSNDLIMTANQQATRTWWNEQRQHFDLYISQIVLLEASSGDQDAAERRLRVLEELPQLNISDEALILAERLISDHALPDTAQDDALHIAVSAVHGMEYLLTWNCKHIANAVMRPKIERTCRIANYEPPIICTPQELMED
jgi:predicted nucleic acid-binding protein